MLAAALVLVLASPCHSRFQTPPLVPLRPPDTLTADQSATPAQIPSPEDSEIDPVRLAIVSGVTVGAMVGVHLYQENGWWDENRAPFHFREDLDYGLNVDKVGHFYGATLWAFGFRKAFRWAGIDETTSLWLGSGGALMFQTFLEIEDGFSAWGFDRVDFLANALGAGWPILQHSTPFFRNFDVKLSYLPSDLIDKEGRFTGQRHLVMDDYEGQTFWLGVRAGSLIGGELDPWWPDFLGLAVGYGARDIDNPGSEPYSVVYVALDLDMTKIIPQTTPFLVTLSEALNFIHLPTPAIRIEPSYVFYGIYF